MKRATLFAKLIVICVQFHNDFAGDEEDKPDAPDGFVDGDEPLPAHLTEDQTVWFDAISEGNVVEIKELLDSGSDSGWKNKVKNYVTACGQVMHFRLWEYSQVKTQE